MLKTIRKELHRTDKSMYRVSKDTGIDNAVLSRLKNSTGDYDLANKTAEALLNYFGYELTKKGQKNGKSNQNTGAKR